MTADDDAPPPALSRGRKITGAEARRIADEVLRENEQRRLPPADDRPCRSCGRPFRPTHDADSPGPTSRHPFAPVPAGRTPAGFDSDGTPYYPTTVGQLGLCGPLSDDTSVGPDTARHTPAADDQAARAREVGQALAAAEFYDAVEDDVARVLADEVKRLQARTHEIQAQEMTKRAALDSELAEWRQRYEEAKRWTERNELRAEWASGEYAAHPFWSMTSYNARSALLRLVTERDESCAALAAVRALADDLDRNADKIEATGRIDSLAIAGWTSYRKIAARIRAAVLDGDQ